MDKWDQELLEQLELLMKKKFRMANELYDNTYHIQEVLKQNDKTSCAIALSIRGKTMDAYASLNQEVERLLRNYKIQQREYYVLFTIGKHLELLNQENELQYKMKQILKSIRERLQKTIALDESISTRLLGKESIYRG